MPMKKEYDYSNGVRGKFHRPRARLNPPIYLHDEDMADFVRQFAKHKTLDAQTTVSRILRGNKKIIQAGQWHAATGSQLAGCDVVSPVDRYCPKADGMTSSAPMSGAPVRF